jgi:hypothetical protein
MTDLERDLTHTLNARVNGLGLLPLPPPARVTRRIRRRQAAWMLGTVTLTATLVTASLVGVEALSGGSGKPAAELGRTTQLTSAGVTLRHPSSWRGLSLLSKRPRYVGRPDVTSVLPLLQVTNFDPAAAGGPICPDRPGRAGSFPRSGILLYVEEDLAFPGPSPILRSWPVRAAPARPSTLPANVCTSGAERIRWAAAGRVFDARLVAGPDASQSDAAAMAATFEQMHFGQRTWSVNQQGPFRIPLDRPQIVLQGMFEGGQWTLVQQRTDQGTCAHVEYPSGVLTWVDYDGCVDKAARQVLARAGLNYDQNTFRRPDAPLVNFIWGQVVVAAERVQLRLKDGRVLEARLAPISTEELKWFAIVGAGPQASPGPRVGPGEPVFRGELVAIDGAGVQVARLGDVNLVG